MWRIQSFQQNCSTRVICQCTTLDLTQSYRLKTPNTYQPLSSRPMICIYKLHCFTQLSTTLPQTSDLSVHKADTQLPSILPQTSDLSTHSYPSHFFAAHTAGSKTELCQFVGIFLPTFQLNTEHSLSLSPSHRIGVGRGGGGGWIHPHFPSISM